MIGDLLSRYIKKYSAFLGGEKNYRNGGYHDATKPDAKRMLIQSLIPSYIMESDNLLLANVNKNLLKIRKDQDDSLFSLSKQGRKHVYSDCYQILDNRMLVIFGANISRWGGRTETYTRVRNLRRSLKKLNGIFKSVGFYLKYNEDFTKLPDGYFKEDEFCEPLFSNVNNVIESNARKQSALYKGALPKFIKDGFIKKINVSRDYAFELTFDCKERANLIGNLLWNMEETKGSKDNE